MEAYDSSATDRVPTVGDRFVAAPDPAVETVEIDSEALLYYPDRTDRVAVNAGTALIWACLDGKSTLGEIAADLAETFHVGFETMLADVTAAVGDLVGRGMVRDARQPSAASPHARVSAARPLADSDFPLGDEGTLAVRIGGDVVGVRTNDREILDLLRGALAPIVVEERAIPRLSLLVTPDRGRIAGLCFLYRDDGLVFRSASRGRALRATLAHLDRFLLAPDGTIRLNARVLVGEKGVVVVGGAYLEMLELAGPHLASMGWQVLDDPAAVIDRGDFSAVVNPPRIKLDPVGIAAIDARFPPRRDEATRSGRYAIMKMIVVGGEPYAEKPASPAQRLAVLLPLVTWVDTRIQRADVEWLWQLATHVGDVRWLFSSDDQELFGALAGRASRLMKPLPR